MGLGSKESALRRRHSKNTFVPGLSQGDFPALLTFTSPPVVPDAQGDSASKQAFSVGFLHPLKHTRLMRILGFRGAPALLHGSLTWQWSQQQ